MSTEPVSTVVIPTYERHEHLKRCLNHLVYQFNKDEKRIAINVLDGSGKECSAKNIDLCRSLDILHFNYEESFPPLVRFCEGVLGVNTEYVSLLADDDLLMPEGYFKALSFLQQHKDYVGAHGQYVRLENAQGRENRLEPLYDYGTSIESKSAMERLFVYFANYYPLFYGLFRTPVLQQAYRELLFEDEGLEGAFIELLPSAVVLCYGSVKKTDGVYLAREIGGPNYVPAEKWLYQEHFYGRYERFKRGVLRHYSEDLFSEENREEAINIAFSAFFGKVFSADAMLKQLQRLAAS